MDIEHPKNLSVALPGAVSGDWSRRRTKNPAIPSMTNGEFHIGDKIRVTGYRPGNYPPGVEDELGTEDLFRSMAGRRYTIRGFDDYGNIELQPKRWHTIWIEPDLVKLVKSRTK